VNGAALWHEPSERSQGRAALHEHLREISRVHPFMAITHVETLATDIRSPAEQQINPDARHVDPAEPVTVRDAPLVSRQLR